MQYDDSCINLHHKPINNPSLVCCGVCVCLCMCVCVCACVGKFPKPMCPFCSLLIAGFPCIHIHMIEEVTWLLQLNNWLDNTRSKIHSVYMTPLICPNYISCMIVWSLKIKKKITERMEWQALDFFFHLLWRNINKQMKNGFPLVTIYSTLIWLSLVRI
jgi:hypothetical protein